MTALWDMNVNVPVQNRIIQRDNPTLCKVSPLDYSFCVRNHTVFFFFGGGDFVMRTTYLKGLLDEKRKINHR